MALSRLQWGMIIAGILLILALVLVYVFVLNKKPQPKVTSTGDVTEFTVDGYGNVFDAQGLYVGRDNGDDSWTNTTGAIYDFNDNLLKAAPVGGTWSPVTTPTAGTVVMQVAPAPGEPSYNLVDLLPK